MYKILRFFGGQGGQKFTAEAQRTQREKGVEGLRAKYKEPSKKLKVKSDGINSE